MAAIKSLSDVGSKWVRRAGSAGAEYLEGVSNPRRDWKTSTKAAEGNFEMGIQAAIQRKSFSKGVEEAGTEKWQKKAVELGSARFPTGVQAAESDYNAGFAPFHATIAALQLPPRGAKGSPQNLNRVAAVANALRAKKVGK